MQRQSKPNSQRTTGKVSEAKEIENVALSKMPEEKPAFIPPLIITITELTEQQKAELYKIPRPEPVFGLVVNNEYKDKVSALELVKFWVIYAASVTPDAHFIFVDKVNVAIRMGTNSSTNAYDLKYFYKGTKNDNPVSSSVRTEVNKLIDKFLPKNTEACNYIAEKFSLYDTNHKIVRKSPIKAKDRIREVRFKNITLKIENPEPETTIIAELCNRSNDEKLKTFILSAVGIKYPQDSQSNPTPLNSVTPASQ